MTYDDIVEMLEESNLPLARLFVRLKGSLLHLHTPPYDLIPTER